MIKVVLITEKTVVTKAEPVTNTTFYLRLFSSCNKKRIRTHTHMNAHIKDPPVAYLSLVLWYEASIV